MEMYCLAHGTRLVRRFGRAKRTWLARDNGWVFRLTCGCSRYLIREDCDEQALEREFFFSAEGDGKFLSYHHNVGLRTLDKLAWAYPRPPADSSDSGTRTRARRFRASTNRRSSR